MITFDVFMILVGSEAVAEVPSYNLELGLSSEKKYLVKRKNHFHAFYYFSRFLNIIYPLCIQIRDCTVQLDIDMCCHIVGHTLHLHISLYNVFHKNRPSKLNTIILSLMITMVFGISNFCKT